MVRALILLFVLERLVVFGAQRAEHGFRSQRQFGEPHADRVVDGIGDGRRDAEGRDLADALGAERTVRLLGLDRFVFHRAGTSWMPGIL